jgi:hypothetical protein
MNNSDRLPHLPLRGNALPSRAGWLAAVIGVAVASAATAAPQLTTIEECLESGTRAVSLPGSASGTLSASPCSGCPTLRLNFGEGTVYLIGKERVSYAKFLDVAGKGDQQLDVFYQPQTRILTRLRLPAAGNEK